MSEIQKNEAYAKLTPQRQALVDEVLKHLEQGEGLWKQGWKMSGVPESAVTSKQYRGVNNFYLTIMAMAQGYSDNRWATFRQMEDKGWHFKTDEEGKSLGKGRGVTIEFFELRDKETGRSFDKHVMDGMSQDEKDDYFKDNVRPVRKYYRVFNGDLIDGIPQKEKQELDPSGRVERADKLIDYWNRNEAKIIHGGSSAYYSPSKDEIHVPNQEDFSDMPEYYVTTLHEMGHSTGHEKRLNREIKNSFGSPEYAIEELRAEIASMFMEQELGVSVTENHIQNNSAYIKNWHDEIKENPNALFTAIADADKISKFIMSKENQNKKIEQYAIVQDENNYGEQVYKVYMVAPHGQTALGLGYGFASREALMQEFEKMQTMPFWADSEFQEVTFDELQQASIDRAEENEVETAKSEVYKKPSEIAAMGVKEKKPVDMAGRGIDSLTKMSDKEVVDKASKTKNGEKFTTLYNGGSVLEGEEKNERSIMARLAMFCNGDKEQLLRIFKSSGQYHEEKPNAFYERMASESMQFVSRIRNENAPLRTNNNGNKNHSSQNSKR